jgi:hypothetical protein
VKFIVALSVFCVVATVQAEDEDIVKDKSPDGKFELQITQEAEGWSAAIVDRKSKEHVVKLDIYQNFTKTARLLWSKDSKRVAYFEPDRRGGGTTVYFREGSEWKEVSLPGFPSCEDKSAEKNSGDKYLKYLEETTRPVKWLSSGELVLAVRHEWEMESGATHRCGQTITIAFDANHEPSIKSVKQQ